MSPDTTDLPDVDLFLRTSGEQRTSNFLIWQAAYAELYTTEVLWPDFGADAFDAWWVDEFFRRPVRNTRGEVVGEGRQQLVVGVAQLLGRFTLGGVAGVNLEAGGAFSRDPRGFVNSTNIPAAERFWNSSNQFSP